jgi:HK97 family phage major capsid protein
MAYALADQEDNEIINGDSTSAYGGVTGLKQSLGAGGVSTAATGHDTWAKLDMADLTAAMALLPDRYHARGPVWVCSAAFYFNVMLRIHASAGGNTILSLQGGDGGVKNFLGFPVFTTQYMPTATATETVCAFFGAFSAGCLLGERIGVRIARSDDFAFLNDLTTLRATTRYDFNCHDPGTASAAGAYVGLKTAAS